MIVMVVQLGLGKWRARGAWVCVSAHPSYIPALAGLQLCKHGSHQTAAEQGYWRGVREFVSKLKAIGSCKLQGRDQVGC